MSGERGTVRSLREQAPAKTETADGYIVEWSPETGVLVDFPGNPHGPIRASSVARLSVHEIEAAISSRSLVVLAFERGDTNRPIILGVVPAEPWLPHDASSAADATVGSSPLTHDEGELSARVDGREVIVEGSERVELRCGKASIILTKAGKVILRGTYVSATSTGAHRIRGGSVEIN